MHTRNVLVTGGIQGIGCAVVQSLCQRGDRVFVFDCVPQDDQRAIQLIELGVSYHCVDIASSASILQAFKQIPLQLDLLVNNAGITRDGLAIRMTESDWDGVLDINLKGAFLCSQHALKRMINQSKSYIINMSSVVGIWGNAGQANYAASKGGLIALTKSLAQEYASRNVLVNAIAPGFIKTGMTESLSDVVKQKALDCIPLKRFGMPTDIAHLVLFLSSGMADYITGQVIEVSGGM